MTPIECIQTDRYFNLKNPLALAGRRGTWKSHPLLASISENNFWRRRRTGLQERGVRVEGGGGGADGGGGGAREGSGAATAAAMLRASQSRSGPAP